MLPPIEYNGSLPGEGDCVDLVAAHTAEIEVGWHAQRGVPSPRRRLRVSCSCGFNGPWRSTRKSSNTDRDRHWERAAEQEASR